MGRSSRKGTISTLKNLKHLGDIETTDTNYDLTLKLIQFQWYRVE